MTIDSAYNMLYMGALIIFAVLIGIMLIRSVIGPRITDRILAVNMIGTMIICCIAILSRYLEEGYLVDVALIYAMISFVSVLIYASTYIPARPGRKPLNSFRRAKRNRRGREAAPSLFEKEKEPAGAADSLPSPGEDERKAAGTAARGGFTRVPKGGAR